MKALRIQSLALLTIFISAICASAQNGSVRTITNADLEKYRAARVKSDEDYRQNYAQRGMPSPEELEKREDERQKRLSELSFKLREQRLQKEYLEQLSAAGPGGPQIIYLAPQENYVPNQYGYYPFGFITGAFGGGVKFRTQSNVQMVRDRANTFFDQRSNNFRRNGFRGGLRTAGPRPVFSPRRR